MNQVKNSLKDIVALCKRRGFIYPGSELYGGFANTYSYGPYGTQLKKNIKDLWWKTFVQSRQDMIGLDGPILLHPRIWEASGHLENFNDALVDCRSCKSRFRADHLLEHHYDEDFDGISLEKMNEYFNEGKISCPKCGKKEFTTARHFNLMFPVQMGKTQNDHFAYLRPETAQAIFVDFKNIIDTTRQRVPFGIAQIGKAFRNEITPGNFIFRTVEFEQMEIEYFIHERDWKEHFRRWLKAMKDWCKHIGLDMNKVEEKEHAKEQLSHYSKRTVDLTYQFPFGTQELYGLAYRTDFDLKRHVEYSKANLSYKDPQTQETYIPHVLEPTFGLDRTILALLCNAYDVENLENGETRTVLHLAPRIAPIKVAIFPLMKKPELVEKAQEVFGMLQPLWDCEFDLSGAIGKRYRRQDELGTPFCLTIDYDTLSDDTVTLRDRDSMKQERVSISSLIATLAKQIH